MHAGRGCKAHFADGGRCYQCGYEDLQGEILEVDDKRIVLTKRGFDRLLHYQISEPTGKYPGKRWRYHTGENPGRPDLPRDELEEGDTGPGHWMMVELEPDPEDERYLVQRYRTVEVVR
jgi:hypothetical protein